MRKIFVFGSNLAGRHGKGAALSAIREHGAIYGIGIGPQGNAYAIPTKDYYINTLPTDIIKEYVEAFIEYAFSHPELKFEVTPIGCGLAGYQPWEIGPMFKGSPENVFLPAVFKEYV
jgi:hypothetical protein